MAQARDITEERTLTSYNPATGDPIDTVPIHSEDDVQSMVARAHEVQPEWAETPMDERAELMRDFRDLLLDRRDEVARLLTDEVGKPLVEALMQEVAMTAEMATYFAKQGPEVLRDQRVKHRLMKNKKSTLVREPKGVIGIITPWNYPLVLSTQSILPALLAGNAVINKPSEYTPLTSLKVQELLLEVGLPEDVLQVATGEGTTGAALVEANVQHISFTGSVETGRKIAARCGERLISCTMELGGKDAAIVLEDAPMERTIGGLTWAAFTNAGQICASLERVFVHESIADDLIDGIVEKASSLRLGPGTDEVDVGPMAMEGQLEKVEDQVRDAREKGAAILTGGNRGPEEGNYFEPTVLIEVDDDMKVLREETFGPLLPIVPVASEEEAIERANDTPFGLTASIWSADTEHAEKLARRVEAGSVYINDHVSPQGGPEVPWGGVKDSGVGRTRGEEGILEMTEPKHFSVDRLTMDEEFFWFPYSRSVQGWLDRLLPWPFKRWLGG